MWKPLSLPQLVYGNLYKHNPFASTLFWKVTILLYASQLKAVLSSEEGSSTPQGPSQDSWLEAKLSSGGVTKSGSPYIKTLSLYTVLEDQDNEPQTPLK